MYFTITLSYSFLCHMANNCRLQRLFLFGRARKTVGKLGLTLVVTALICCFVLSFYSGCQEKKDTRENQGRLKNANLRATLQLC